MKDQHREWIVDKYREIVRGEVDGIELAKTVDIGSHAYLDAIANGDLTPATPDMDYARSMFRAAIAPERTKSRASLKKNVEYLLDALRNPDEGIHVEPFLDEVYPLGSHDGRDKALRHWSDADWTDSTIERYSNAAAVTRAAEEHAEIAREARTVMRTRNVLTFGQVFDAA